MKNKNNIKIVIFSILVILVFIMALIGFKELMGDSFTFLGAFYSTLVFFVLNSIPPQDTTANIYILIAKYLAALLLGFGIYNFLYKYIADQYTRLKVKYSFRRHVIVFSMKMVGPGFISDLVANQYKVVLVEDPSEDDYLEIAGQKGVVVIKESAYETKFFEAILVDHASTCVIAFDNDHLNIGLSLKLIKYLRENGNKHTVRVLMHVQERSNLEVIKDYIGVSDSEQNFELDIFNVNSAAAKKIYDHYPPHTYFDLADTTHENAIAVVGYNTVAEDFIIENIILSHYNGCRNITIYLLDKDADDHLGKFAFNYPFFGEFVDIIPIKLNDNRFSTGFHSSADVVKSVTTVKAAYFFGDDGAALMNMASRFRQFIYSYTLNYLDVPVIICFPEDTGIVNILDAERKSGEKLNDILKEQLNISFVDMIKDTCTSSRLLEEGEYIDLLSRVINYYYSIKYEFEWIMKDKWQIADAASVMAEVESSLLELADKNESLSEADVQRFVLQTIQAKSKIDINELRDVFGIKKWWDHLSYHKKSANRYAARHLTVKIAIMKGMGYTSVSKAGIIESFPVIAPIEHKRWCAEKRVLNYRYGVLPQAKKEKNIAKEILRIHDQLIPYNDLSQIEKEKDLNIFLLMPLLNSLKADNKK